MSGLVTVLEFTFANGPCSCAVCSAGPPPSEFTSQITESWLIQAVGSEEMDVQNPNRISELIKVEEA